MKRGAAWHQGRASGRKGRQAMMAVEPAFEAAEADRVEVAAMARETRREISDHQAMLDGISRVSPAVYAPFSGVEQW